jgi:hypothetical protein
MAPQQKRKRPSSRAPKPPGPRGPARKTSPRRARLETPALDLARASARELRALGRDLKEVLTSHGLDPSTLQIRAEPAPRPALRSAVRGRAARAVPLGCPVGTVRRVVCEFRNGRFVCSEQCVPA